MSDRPTVSDAAERVYAHLRPYQTKDPEYVLLRLCELAAIALRKPTDALRHDDRGSGARRMRDPLRCPDWALEHLAQYVGMDPADFPPATTPEQLRELIRSMPRTRRGTRSAIVAAVKPFLVGLQRVKVIPRVGGSAFAYAVVTYTADTPPANEPLILAALKAQKPTRLKLTYLVVDGWTLAEFEAAYATLADGETAFATLADLENNDPI